MDFSLIMFIALCILGAIWAWDRVFAAPHRRAAVEAMRTTREAPASDLQEAGREPFLVELSRTFFPVILLVFVLRAFTVEPFRIPSASMTPTLLKGDFILVNKFLYGLRVPVLNTKFIGIKSPQRGDVMVFRYPGDPSVNYIKRVVGLPGDRIGYGARTVYVNGQPMAQQDLDSYAYTETGSREIQAQRKTESLGEVQHQILLDAAVGGGAGRGGEGEWTVPAGQYFVMGDNRDHSNDSRYWGFVPDELVVGRAFLIWFSWNSGNAHGVNWSRMGTVIK